ncbi:MAG: hypothetical protein QOJ98_1266, partial [Acidobacteriota bacterium]|nr:hypothetical protein [Acidobacteriota bacterium]
MDEADNVVPITKRTGWRVALASAAVAAGLVVVFGPMIRTRLTGPSVETVVAAGEKSPYRPSPGRLSIEVPYKRPKPVLRNGGGEEPPLVDSEVPSEVYGVVEDLEAANRPDPHARGVAYLMEFKPKEAIPHLREAAKTDQAAITDLAAALIASGGDEELTEAIKLSEGSRTPTALWNRAMALHNLRDEKSALQAWKDYLAVDPTSPWAVEAREKMQDLAY